MLGLIQFNVCVEDIIPSKDLQLIRTNVILWNLDDVRGDFGLKADFIFLNQSERESHTRRHKMNGATIKGNFRYLNGGFGVRRCPCSIIIFLLNI